MKFSSKELNFTEICSKIRRELKFCRYLVAIKEARRRKLLNAKKRNHAIILALYFIQS